MFATAERTFATAERMFATAECTFRSGEHRLQEYFVNPSKVVNN